jgi:hypothetical protein
MMLKAMRNITRKTVLLLIGFLLVLSATFAQEPGDPVKTYHFNGNVSVTNNGFSLVPTFSLGKPAAVAQLSMGGERFSFEPQFRFNLEDLQPWSFIFIWRYAVVKRERFQLKAGLHLPALSFQAQIFNLDGDSVDQVVPARFIAAELMPLYQVSKRISVGMYILPGYGVDREGQTLSSKFVSLKAGFSQIPLFSKFYFSWSPQLYYLNMNGSGGIYTAHSFSLGHQKFRFP